MYVAHIFLVICCLATVNNAIPREPSDQVLYKGVRMADKTPKELESIFSSSIIHWSLDPSMLESENANERQEIMKRLVNISENSKECVCPKLLGLHVCASNGQLYTTICDFHCGLAKSGEKGITPVMIFDVVSGDAAEMVTREEKAFTMCTRWYRGSKHQPKELQW